METTAPTISSKKRSIFSKMLEGFYRTGARVVTHIIYNVRYTGTEHIPKEGAAILICNHVSYMDGMVLQTGIKRNIRFIIDEEIYNTPGVHHFMSIANAIPIMPNKESVRAALDEVAEGLRNGDIICIFPEGFITYTGNMMRFRFGVEWMVKETPVPIIPIALTGLWGSILSRKYLGQKWAFVPRSFRRRIRVKIGAPIPPEKAQINYLQRVVMQLKNDLNQSK